MDFSIFAREPLLPKLLSSAFLIVIALLLRSGLRKTVLTHVDPPALRRRWLVDIRNVTFLLVIAGLGAIWAETLRSVGVTLLALGVALVIATKELIQCLSGSVLRALSHSYQIGDRIEIDGLRGDVVDITPFTTTLLEVGPGRTFHMRTGRAITVPNSKMIEKPVINESHMKQYVLHVMTVPLKLEADWKRAEQMLLECANEECASFVNESSRYMKQLEKTQGLESPPVHPRVALQIPEPGQVHLLLRMPSPVGRQGKLEQAVLRKFLERFQNGKMGKTPDTAAGGPDRTT